MYVLSFRNSVRASSEEEWRTKQGERESVAAFLDFSQANQFGITCVGTVLTKQLGLILIYIICYAAAAAVAGKLFSSSNTGD